MYGESNPESVSSFGEAIGSAVGKALEAGLAMFFGIITGGIFVILLLIYIILLIRSD